MPDSIKYTVYPAAQKKPGMGVILLVVGAAVLTTVFAFMYLRKSAPVEPSIPTPTVAPLVPNPAPVPNPR